MIRALIIARLPTSNTDWTPDLTPELNAEVVVNEMIAHLQTGKPQVTVGISGMSGSGKTTLANEVGQALLQHFGERIPQPVRLSTDDYHRGKAWLEATYGAPWTNWDAPEVYDTTGMARDVAALHAGQSINKQHFDFEH